MTDVAEQVCRFEGCGRPVAARGLCPGHRTQEDRGQALRALRPYGVGGKVTLPGVAVPAHLATLLAANGATLYAGTKAALEEWAASRGTTE